MNRGSYRLSQALAWLLENHDWEGRGGAKNVRNSLGPVIKRLDDPRIEELTSTKINAFLTKQLENGISFNMVRSYRKAIVFMLTYFAKVELPGIVREKDIISLEDQRLRENPQQVRRVPPAASQDFFEAHFEVVPLAEILPQLRQYHGRFSSLILQLKEKLAHLRPGDAFLMDIPPEFKDPRKIRSMRASLTNGFRIHHVPYQVKHLQARNCLAFIPRERKI